MGGTTRLVADADTAARDGVRLGYEQEDGGGSDDWAQAVSGGEKARGSAGAGMRLGRCALIARERLRPCASLRSYLRLPDSIVYENR